MTKKKFISKFQDVVSSFAPYVMTKDGQWVVVLNHKRPYNLFHRKNLYVRLTDVERSFGNKKTWDTPFEIHFRHFVKEANQAIFNNGKICMAINKDAVTIDNTFDLVYIDTPYLNNKGVGVDYADFYHFLDGLVNYDEWYRMIDYSSRHHRLKR